jgi:pimeloyl-ACP methyl ester carboxylesterase
VTLANRLAAAPLRGSVRETSGRSTPVVLGAVDFLGLVTDADLSPGLAAVLPAVVHAAVAGRPLPLLHLVQLANRASGASDSDVSFALYLATECGDGPFPWSPETPVAARDEAVQAALAALPVGTFGPFGPWVEGFGDTDLCVGWPSPAGRGGALGAGPLPDVPVLALSGGLDLRTPTSGAAAVVARFPQGRLLVVPGVGHSVLTTDPTGCSQRAVRQWMLGLAPATACARAKPYLAPLAAYPVPSSKKLDARQTLGVVTRTVREAEATWLLTDTGAARQAPVSGLYGGKLVSSGRVIELDKYSIAPGVNVTGALMLRKAGPPLIFKGALFVRGSTAAQGVLQLSGGALHGTLGRRKVGG